MLKSDIKIVLDWLECNSRSCKYFLIVHYAFPKRIFSHTKLVNFIIYL